MASINWSHYFLLACIFVHAVVATPELVVYWGQNSAGNLYTEPDLQEQPLRNYCVNPSYSIIVIGFVYLFPTAPGSVYPGMNLANHCSDYFAGNPYLLNCTDVASDIAYCQSIGKTIMMSFGGGVGQYGFSSDSEAQAFATMVWNLFLGGTSPVRPFGDVIVDGVDLDIEGGYITGYAAFVDALRAYFSTSSKTYYISAAPQCVYPDGYLGPGAGTAFQSSWFDFIWVQFYNNYCGLNAYPSEFNYDSWANWASTISVNPNVKVFIGAPGSSNAAGSGYVDAATLQTISTAIEGQYDSVYGGVMLWDTSAAQLNNEFENSVAAFLGTSSASVPSSTTGTTGSSPSNPIPVSPPASLTTSEPASLTTSEPASHTTGHKASQSSSAHTTGHSTHTTGRTHTTGHSQHTTSAMPSGVQIEVTGTSGPVVGNTGSSSGSGSSSSSSSSSTTGALTTSCITGYMRCATSETYQTCAHEEWGPIQDCSIGTTCSPSGNYIYCV